MNDVPSTTTSVVTYADLGSGVYGITYGGAIFEAADPHGIAPSVGESVIIDYMPGSMQWILVAVLPP